MFNPNIQQMSTRVKLQHRVIADINGASEVSYKDGGRYFCNWKGKGGTESTISGSFLVFDTAELTMWYDPSFTVMDRVLLNEDLKFAYEITNIENIEMRNQYMIVKVSRAVNA